MQYIGIFGFGTLVSIPLLATCKEKEVIYQCVYVALIFSRGISISKFGDRPDILIGFLNVRLEYKSGT